MALPLEDLQFLIVEDNTPMRRLLRVILHSMGVSEVHEAMDASEAITLMRRDGPPDILLTDWAMVPLDGLALTRYIRHSPDSPNRFLPIIMMTGFADRQRVLAARDAGVTEFLVKPLSAQTLFGRVQAIIEQPRPFVEAGEFFGPDRRRPNAPAYFGKERRVRSGPTMPPPVGGEISQDTINALFNP